MPKLPFSLFDFKQIDKIEPILKITTAAAGDAIPNTTLYEVPKHKFALLLGISMVSTKTTGTALLCFINRVNPIGGGSIFVDTLIKETISSAAASWPSQKTTAEHIIGWHLCFLWAGDKILFSHALTVAETIVNECVIHRIEYSDPRYEK